MSQLFLTGFIATRLGVTVLLVTVPIVMVFGLTVFALSGTFIVLAVAMVIRRWGEYAFIRPGREMLFSKVDKESKYKAKNLIDVAVYRIADAGFAQLKKFLEAVGMSGTAEALVHRRHCARSGRSTAGGSAAATRRKKSRSRGRLASEESRTSASDEITTVALSGNSGSAAPVARVMPSSVIRSYRYDPQQKRLELVFVSGRRYRYHDVPEETCTADAPRLLEGRVLQRAYPRSVSLHRGLTLMARCPLRSSSADCSIRAVRACACRAGFHLARARNSELLRAACETLSIRAFRFPRMGQASGKPCR